MKQGYENCRPACVPVPRRPRLRRLSVALGLAFSAAVPGQAAMAEEGLTLIEELPGNRVRLMAVSDDGLVAAGSYRTDTNEYHAMYWTESGGTVDIGPSGTRSYALSVSGDGSAISGYVQVSGFNHAFRWTEAGGMVDLGTLGGTTSAGYGISDDGATVVGYTTLASAEQRAFRWTETGGMVDLGTLGATYNGAYSDAYAVSGDGSVVVGEATSDESYSQHAFRWELGATADGTTLFDTTGSSGGAMMDLGTLGGDSSSASGVSNDGSVVVGYAYDADNYAHAFRWTGSGGMFDLGFLPGGSMDSGANAVSGDGNVVVGYAQDGDGNERAFRWTAATGMLTVEDWLRAGGVTVATDISGQATGANSDGSVVVGMNNDSATSFFARGGSGIVTVEDVQTSLAATAGGAGMALTAANTLINGAHGRPLMRRVDSGRRAFWLAGDWGRDDHGVRDGDLGLAELGLGKNLGEAQVNVALGQTWAKQAMAANGRAENEGTYLLAEALIPLGGKLWATLGGYGHWGEADLKRGYLNGGLQDYSGGRPDVDTWSVRARLDWDAAYQVGAAAFSPYVDLSHTRARMEAYTETGGGFPAHFNASEDKSTELRLGVNTVRPLANGLNLLGTLEAAHRFQKTSVGVSGEVVGLFGFDLEGADNKRTWLRAGAGVEGQMAGGLASLSLNVTSRGDAPSFWLAVNWQRAF